jgi:hypothetical protein
MINFALLPHKAYMQPLTNSVGKAAIAAHPAATQLEALRALPAPQPEGPSPSLSMAIGQTSPSPPTLPAS